MTDDVANTPFLFPADRFPSWALKSEAPVPAEEFGPALTFNPQSPKYRTAVGQDIQQPGFQFVPTTGEIRAQQMLVSYNCVTDAYYRPPSPSMFEGNSVYVSHWHTAIWRHYNVERKVEGDWNMTYLARSDISGGNIFKAFVEYRFNLQPAGLKVKNLSVRVPFATFRDGKVRVLVCSRDDYTTLLDAQESRSVIRAKGWDDFVIRVELSGEEVRPEGVMYQYAQLFRQPLTQPPTHADWRDPFRVVIDMEPLERAK